MPDPSQTSCRLDSLARLCRSLHVAVPSPYPLPLLGETEARERLRIAFRDVTLIYAK